MRRGRPPYPGILTPREQEVLVLLQQGLSNEEIAERLDISIAGAKFHVSEIITRLGVESRHEAAAWQPAESRFFGVAFLAVFLKKLPFEGAMKLTTGAILTGAVGVVVLIAIGVLVMESRGGGSVATEPAIRSTETAAMSLRFNGDLCVYDGPTQIGLGALVVVVENRSEVTAEFAIFLLAGQGSFGLPEADIFEERKQIAAEWDVEPSLNPIGSTALMLGPHESGEFRLTVRAGGLARNYALLCRSLAAARSVGQSGEIPNVVVAAYLEVIE